MTREVNVTYKTSLKFMDIDKEDIVNIRGLLKIKTSVPSSLLGWLDAFIVPDVLDSLKKSLDLIFLVLLEEEEPLKSEPMLREWSPVNFQETWLMSALSVPLLMEYKFTFWVIIL